MITTFSGAAVRRQTSEAGKFSLPVPAPVARPGGRGPPRRGTRAGRRPGRARRPRPARTAARTSRARRWASRTWRLSGSIRASSGVPSSRNSGWWMTYWSTGRARRDEDRDARALAPPGAAELLPGRRDRARIAGQDRHVERADVDAELERVRRDDAEDLAVAQAVLDRAALRRQVAAAVAADAASAARSSRAAPRAGRSSRISTATRDRPKTIVWRPARRNGSAQRWARVRADPRAPLAGSRIGGSTSRTCRSPAARRSGR